MSGGAGRPAQVAAPVCPQNRTGLLYLNQVGETLGKSAGTAGQMQARKRKKGNLRDDDAGLHAADGVGFIDVNVHGGGEFLADADDDVVEHDLPGSGGCGAWLR